MNRKQNTEPIGNQGNPLLPIGSYCGLTEIENTEREMLLKLQKSNIKWFSKQEFNRLKELSNKMFKNAGSADSV